jgi:hypothetical protein
MYFLFFVDLIFETNSARGTDKTVFSASVKFEYSSLG